MRINSRQAADFLKCSTNTIRGLVAKKRLTDLGVTTPGQTKHTCWFDYKEVRELAKVWKPQPYTPRAKKPNGAVEPVQPVQTTPISEYMMWEKLERIEQKQQQIEEKLDQLIQLWK